MKWTRILDSNKPWPWLPYLALYFMPWAFYAPSTAQITASAIGIPPFLAFYFLSYKYDNEGRVVCGAGMAAIGFGLAPIMPTSSNLLIYAAAAYGMAKSRRLGITALGLQLVIIALFSIAFQLPWFFWAVAAFFTIMIGGGCLMSSELIATNEALKASQSKVASLAAEAERERIARDLHDLLGHSLSVIAVKGDLGSKLIQSDPTAAEKELKEIQQIARDGLKDIRDAVSGMKQMSLAAEIGLARRALASADITFEATNSTNELPDKVETTLAMLVREGVTNVVRHACASHCIIHVIKNDNEATFVIEDNGVGKIAKEGNGLKGMRERVASHGGELSISCDTGTRIKATLPLPLKDAA